MEWSLPPDIPWPQFLRMLRHPAPPKGWLEAAAEIENVRKRPLLLRWIAQHRKVPESLRAQLLSRLPWRALALIAEDPSAHPKARSTSAERLQVQWNVMSMGERRSLAYRAPRNMWPQVWKIRDTGVIHAFLQHPKLSAESLTSLIQPPLLPTHAEALVHSKWREIQPVAHQVLLALDRSFQMPDCALVLGHAAPWIRALSMEERLVASARMTHPPLRKMTRAWALPEMDPED